MQAPAVRSPSGHAVLDAIEEDGLMQHARQVGEHLQARLRSLMATPAGKLIGDVRGSGLFLGVELVTESAPAKHVEVNE